MSNEDDKNEYINIHNNIEDSEFFLKNISKYTILKNLNILNCKLSYIPESLYDISSLQILNLNKNKIKYISPNIKNLKNLTDLYLSFNFIETIPDEIGECIKLKNLCVSHNLIQTIPKTIGNLKKLKFLYIDNNQLSSLPCELTNCNNLMYVLFLPQNKYFKIKPHILRFINRYSSSSYDNFKLYKNSENVHTNSIQHSLRKSLNSLINDDIDKSINFLEYIDDILKQYVSVNLNDKTILSNTYLTYEDIFNCVMNRILNSNNKDELLKRVHEEINESINLCFTGKITRLVNSLTGFFSDIHIGISDNEQIENLMICSLKNENPKDFFQKEMIERGYDINIIQTYLTYIDDYLKL